VAVRVQVGDANTGITKGRELRMTLRDDFVAVDSSEQRLPYDRRQREVPAGPRVGERLPA
jgi:hypothetical protein